LPSRLLDLGKPDHPNLKLVLSKNIEISPYAALSYCWGTSNSLKATGNNIRELQVGIDASSMPRTVQDAILVLRTLNIRYLWVDALCIIQNDMSDWYDESAAMASIYTNSEITIMAACASSSTQTFLSPRTGRHVSKEEINGSGQMSLFYLVCCESRFTSIRDAKLQQKEPLFKRAWVVQERLLSRKKLIFGSNQVFWECAEGEASEDKQISIRGPWSKRESIWNQWYQTVCDFSACKISRQTDIFPAISGIAKLVAEETKFTYVAGIWLENLPYDLLWQTKSGSKKDKREIFVAPSFSWASSDGTVVFPWDTNPSSLMYLTLFSYLSHHQSLPAGSSDPYGAIKDAAIVLEGCLLPAVDRISTDHTSLVVKLKKEEKEEESDSDVRNKLYSKIKLRKAEKVCIPAEYDNSVGAKHEAFEVFLLPLRLRKDKSEIESLILLRLSEGENSRYFKRIGISICYAGQLTDHDNSSLKYQQLEELFSYFITKIESHNKEEIVLR